MAKIFATVGLKTNTVWKKSQSKSSFAQPAKGTKTPARVGGAVAQVRRQMEYGKIDREKHLQTTLKEFNRALDIIEEILSNKEYESYPYFLDIVRMAVFWYENDYIETYQFFGKAIPTSHRDPTEFYASLSSFLINVILDDSYYKLCWEKYEGKADFVEGESWKDNPYVVWGNDSDNHNAGLMWKAMQFLENKRLNRLKEWEEFGW